MLLTPSRPGMACDRYGFIAKVKNYRLSLGNLRPGAGRAQGLKGLSSYNGAIIGSSPEMQSRAKIGNWKVFVVFKVKRLALS
jgi:hypothetical protein